MTHEWTTEEVLAVFALTKRFGTTGWRDDSLAKELLARGISKGSVGMAIQGFLYLMGLPGGLNHPSRRQREVFAEYKGCGKDELRKLAQERLRG